LAQYGGGYLVAISASQFVFFNLGGGVSYGTATGGIGAPTAVTIGGVDYEYLTFNATGTLTIVSPGLFDVLAWLVAVVVQVVAVQTMAQVAVALVK
jgi:hypothetical protein